MAAPGMVLSQATSATMPSNMWPRATSSIESAMRSRLTSDAFIPSVPMVMPSLIAMVLYSIGVPPACRMPSATSTASSRNLKLHGMVPIQVFAMPMIGFFMSSSVRPMAFRNARAGARSLPCVMV